MSTYQFLSGLIKYRYGRIVLILVALTFGFGDICAQHLFSVSYGDLSQAEARQIKEQFARSDISITPLTRGAENEYVISLATVQNTKIIILNEETGRNVVITPTEEAPVQFRLQSFFIEELKQSTMGDAERYLIVETGTDFSVRSAASFLVQPTKVFIPRYFYGQKEDVKEALPKDRQITSIFKEKPRLIPAFPDDPENLRYIAQLEEELSYYVYMYKLPNGTLCIYDEHFNPSVDENEVRASTRAGTNLQFNLSGNLNTQQEAAAQHACDLWGAELAGVVPVSIDVNSASMNMSYLGLSYRQPHYWNPVTETWYCAALGKQLAGYNYAPGMKDIRLELNSNCNWFYGITGNPSNNQLDWITIMLHEITHGLGFSALVRGDGGYIYTTIGGIEGQDTNSPGIFDKQLYQGSIGNTCLTDLNKNERKSLVVSNNLFAGCPSSFLLAANGGNRVKMYAPSPWSSSNVSHWDNNVNFTTFMKSSANKGFRCIVINAREVAIMQDMGWEIPSTISGSDVVCSSATYTLVNGAATSWSVTAGFTIDSYTDTSAIVSTFHVNGKSGTLTAIVNGNLIPKSIKSHKASISGPNFLCPYDLTTYTYSNICTHSNFVKFSIKWSSSQGITLSSPTSQSSVVAHSTSTVPLIVATYPLPALSTVPLSGTISATVTINNVNSTISKNLTLDYPSGTIIGPVNINGQHVVMPMQPGYYKFTVGTDVPSTANVRWVSAPVNSNNPNATADLHFGRTATIYLDWGVNEVRMQYEDNCTRSNPTVMQVAGGYRGMSADTTNFTMDAETLSNELVIQLSPNPVKNSMDVTVEDTTQPILVTVYSSSGIVYLSQTFSTPAFTMDLSRCQPGMLVVRISCGDKYVIKNILKQ